MANRYWVGGMGTWDTTSTANWSTTSGGASGASVPTAADSVIFDANSNGAPYTVTLTGALTCLDFTATAGFAPTFSSTGTLTVSGNFSIMSTVVWNATGAITFNSTTSVTITTNGVSLQCNVVFNGVGGTFNLGGALTTSSTLTSNLTTGTINMNNYNMSFGGFQSTSGLSRTINFGTGIMYITGIALNNNISSTANFFITGTNPSQIVTYTGSGAMSFSHQNVNGTQAAGTWGREIYYKFIAGTYSISSFNSTGRSCDFTGFSGTWSKGGINYIPGDLVLSSTMLVPSSASTTFFNASGTQYITLAGKEWQQPITIGTSGFPSPTVVLNDAFLIQSTASTKGVTLYGGTLNLNGNTMTMAPSGVFTVNDSAAGQTQNITFNGGTIVCPLGFTYTSGNFTTTAGTSPGKISMTGTATFAGGGKTYNTNLSADVAGTITITGANTFTSISNGVTNAALVFPASTTTTVTNWNVSGVVASLCTITSSAPGTQATLSKSSGTVSSNYLSLKDSAATGGATWYAGANSTNVSNNTGWLFSNAPSTAGFLMFLR